MTATYNHAAIIDAITRGQDREVCRLYDIPHAIINKMTHAECQMLIANARIDTALGAKTATGIAIKYGANEPAAPIDTVTRSEMERAITTARRALVADVDTLRNDLTETLVQLTDATPKAIADEVAKAMRAVTPVMLTLQQPNKPNVALGLVHRDTDKLIRMLNAGVNVYLHGPAGSGKTTAAQKAAEAFKLSFYFAAKVESEYALLGFTNAHGDVVRTQFREAYENGGVFLFDELDASAPAAIVALNAALANGVCPFPDGIVTRHKDFKCIAAGNTKLTGANRQYTGRLQMDAASIDRFAFIDWQYDEALEMALAANQLWARYVQAARKAVAERALPHLITPRATYDGCKLLSAGLSAYDVADAVLWKGLDSATVEPLVAAINHEDFNILFEMPTLEASGEAA